jgi:hypothetical protein
MYCEKCIYNQKIFDVVANNIRIETDFYVCSNLKSYHYNKFILKFNSISQTYIYNNIYCNLFIDKNLKQRKNKILKLKRKIKIKIIINFIENLITFGFYKK